MKKHKKFIILALLVFVIIGVCVVARNNFDNSPVVCLDAGHGGKDVGAVLGERYEKDDNLRLAVAVKSDLEKKGVKVVMTRTNDKFISLANRCKCANKKHADLFVALHRNSAESGSGVEIWISSDPSKTESELAQSILNCVEDVGITKNRGVKNGYVGSSDSDYYVNKHTDMPSCLVEMGFITNKEDNELFDSKLDEYAKAIAQGIYDTFQN